MVDAILSSPNTNDLISSYCQTPSFRHVVLALFSLSLFFFRALVLARMYGEKKKMTHTQQARRKERDKKKKKSAQKTTHGRFQPTLTSLAAVKARRPPK